jgi:hypothetical protein
LFIGSLTASVPIGLAQRGTSAAFAAGAAEAEFQMPHATNAVVHDTSARTTDLWDMIPPLPH